MSHKRERQKRSKHHLRLRAPRRGPRLSDNGPMAGRIVEALHKRYENARAVIGQARRANSEACPVRCITLLSRNPRNQWVRVGANGPLVNSCTHPVCPRVVGAPVAAERRRHTYDLAGRGCVYLQAVADVDTDMAYPGLVRVDEEDEVTRLWIANRQRGVELINGNAG